ncbi:lysosomal Pro-X carboxypeptidase-like isoform X1 [Clavelina lepadiformis]|uniref:lysosomal Pro-X carboxypeptidase-like isoform X1 n=2 Tax=Clavelina lepadiformis TaxID=159417 RepID=UPI0040437653
MNTGIQLLGILVVFCPVLISCWNLPRNDNYTYPELHLFEQKLDHFNPTVNTTFMQRYFVSNQYWKKGKGPIFFYTGNEGDITAFINNTGFIWDIAPVFQAMVVFAEHRYYGESKPYGDIQPSVNTTAQYGQLTAEQALADYAEIITELKEHLGYNSIPVVAFGGSYGGMLSAWMRIKYGHIVNGAIASSAPVKYFPGLTNCEKYNQVVTSDFASTAHGPQCVKNIKMAWSVINETVAQTGGLRKLSEIFHTCHQLKSAEELTDWIKDCWSNMAMVDYPYPANFLNPLPGWPVNVTCSYLSVPFEGSDLLKAMYEAVSVYNNYTGKTPCFDTTSAISSSISNSLWDYQWCTEMTMPFCADGVRDMFLPQKWSYENYVKNCKAKYGVIPRPHWAIVNFGAGNLKSASNIIFLNGDLDPWHVGGILEDVSQTVISIKMWGAAHHLDLRHGNKHDPISVIEARHTEMMHIKKWIAEASNIIA